MGTGDTTRRNFLETLGAGATLGLSGLAVGSTVPAAASALAPVAAPRKKIAVLATVYHYLSHAYHIVGRFLDGFDLYDGEGLHKPDFDVVSIFIEQTPEPADLGKATAARHGVKVCPTIEEALTLGTGKLAVDAVLIIAEHGEYPNNAKLQKLYPRGKYFREVVEVFKKSGRSVPVFNDKHLSYDRREAQTMVDTAKELKIPFMAGSSLPVTWRLPAVEVPKGLTWKSALVVSRGEIEIFGFHALETLQCWVERRERKGKPQGVKAVTCLQGDAVWEAGDAGKWSKDLLEPALGRSHTRNVGDIKENTRHFVPPPGNRPTFLRTPLAFLVEYADGFNAGVLIANGHVDDTTIAARLDRAVDPVASTLVYLPAPPGANFFHPLTLRIEEFFRTGVPPYPVERTLLTGGILDAALDSFVAKGKRVETPELASIDYEAPEDSGFIRTPIARP